MRRSAAPSSLAARLLLALCLLASSVQGFVLQAHVHAAPAALHAADADQLAPAESNCPLCEIVAHSPAIAPSSASDVFIAPLFAAGLAPGVDLPAFSPNPSHHWFGRGPPTV
ncbi:MAG: hypothetical protein ABW136_12895 [Steroidobacteraceae bacterium]